MPVSDGVTVHVHYRGTLTDGSEFDSSEGRAPLSFTVGSGQVIPGFDAAVRGLEVGDKVTVTIPAAEAYGERETEAFQEFPRSSLPPEPEPQVGWMLELQHESGQRIPATIAVVGEETVVLDFNHPLAGQDLTFEIELVKTEEPGAEG